MRPLPEKGAGARIHEHIFINPFAMEKIYKDAIVRHIRERITNLTSPAAIQYGYTSIDRSEQSLTELLLLADKLGLYDIQDEIKAARKPLRDEIDRQYVQLGFKPVYAKS